MRQSPPDAVGSTPRERRPIVPVPPRYAVTRRIASGGMATIWEAEDQVLGRHVAIKVLAEHLADQPPFVQRFQREARTVASLSGHSNVITVYDVGEHEGRPFIVTEYLPGGTVADRLRSGQRPAPEEAVRWLHDAASGLEFAHERGVVHRDVKPQNLLFDERGGVVVADLGIARAAFETRLTASGELLGTAAYMAPEQVEGHPGSPAGDQYSLAIVAFELLTGALPFAGGTMAEQARQKLEAEPFRPSGIAPQLPPGVDAVLLRALRRDPDARWPSVARFAEELEQALRGRGPDPEPATDPLSARSWLREDVEPFRPSRRLRRWPAALAAALGLLAIACGVWAISSLGGGGDDGASARKEQRREAREGARADRSGGGTRDQSEKSSSGSSSQPTTASPAQLNDQGFQLMRAGRYDEAIPLLQRAVEAFPAANRDLTHAYALYNLGRSLRLAGRPAEAIRYLERRLRFNNQREAVARELAAARRAAD